MSLDIDVTLQILEQHKASFGGTDTFQNAQIKEAKKLLSRTAEDKREASKLAIDAAKTLVTIGVAVFVALGGFVQFAKKEGLAWADTPIILFALSALLVLLSMILGLVAMSKTWKRGEGSANTDETAWWTPSIKNQLNGQAWAGIVGLVFFGAAIVLWDNAPSNQIPELTFSITSQSQSTQLISGPVFVTGQWSSLTLMPAKGPKIELQPVASGNTGSFSLNWK